MATNFHPINWLPHFSRKMWHWASRHIMTEGFSGLGLGPRKCRHTSWSDRCDVIFSAVLAWSCKVVPYWNNGMSEWFSLIQLLINKYGRPILNQIIVKVIHTKKANYSKRIEVACGWNSVENSFSLCFHSSYNFFSLSLNSITEAISAGFLFSNESQSWLSV